MIVTIILTSLNLLFILYVIGNILYQDHLNKIEITKAALNILSNSLNNNIERTTEVLFEYLELNLSGLSGPKTIFEVKENKFAEGIKLPNIHNFKRLFIKKQYCIIIRTNNIIGSIVTFADLSGKDLVKLREMIIEKSKFDLLK